MTTSDGTDAPLGYYIHHHGRGHLQRATAIAEEWGGGITGLSSLPRPQGWPGEWVLLPRDDEADSTTDQSARGALHWVPLGDDGLRERSAIISAWIAKESPAAFVVDVSVEVALLARLHGVPVVTIAQPGTRGDSAHSLGYRISSVIIAPWPAAALGMLTGTSPAVSRRVLPVGAISRPAAAAGRIKRRTVTLLLGGGGHSINRYAIDAAMASSPEWEWTVLGGDSTWIDDTRAVVAGSEVIVSHAGQNAVAEIAAARRPSVIIPQDRPFEEQATTALVLEAGRWPTTVLTDFPTRGWSPILERAAKLDGQRWAEWNDGGGAARAGESIRTLIRASTPHKSPAKVIAHA